MKQEISPKFRQKGQDLSGNVEKFEFERSFVCQSVESW